MKIMIKISVSSEKEKSFREIFAFFATFFSATILLRFRISFAREKMRKFSVTFANFFAKINEAKTKRNFAKKNFAKMRNA